MSTPLGKARFLGWGGVEGLWLLSMLITWESFVCDVVRVRGSEEGVVFWKEKPNCYTQEGEGGGMRGRGEGKTKTNEGD